MVGIAQKNGPAFHGPRRAFDRDHRPRRVGEVIIGEMWRQWNYIRKASLEKLDYIGGRGQRGKTVRSLEGQKQDTGKRAVNIGQGDEHEVATRPNAQPVLLPSMPAIVLGRNGEL